MKILQINAVGQASSTGRNCKELAEYINTKTTHICYTAFAQGELVKYTYQIGNIFDWKLHAFLSRISGRQGHFSKIATRKLISFIDMNKFDIVHLGNLHGNYINYPMLLKFLAKKNIPTVVTLHDCWFFTGKCFYYTLKKCNKWMTGCGECPKVREDNKSWIFDTTKSMWEEKQDLFSKIPRLGVIGVSDWITEEAKKSLLNNAKYIKRIYNWVDLDVFKPYFNDDLRKKLKLADRFIILGVASNWDNQKGLNSFIELSKLLKNNEVIVLVGKMSTDEELPRNIISVGETDSVNELAKYYSMSDVFVTLSLQETFGKVSAEALACGTPVICFDSTANKELPDNDSGSVVDMSLGIKGIANAIGDIKKKDYAMMSAHCRKRAEKLFARDINIEEHIKFYEMLLKL